MLLAPLLALSMLAADPAAPAGSASAPPAAPPAASPAVSNARPDDLPPGAPADDFGLVAWCFGALGEYLSIYDDITPDLKAIDKIWGTPVVEDRPYTADMAAARLAEQRFAAAMDAAEKASAQPLGQYGLDSIAKGRSIWSMVRLKSRRNLVDAWLFWGVPERCETTSKALAARASLLGQAMAGAAPAVDSPAKPAREPTDPR
jgi:hypothetical protein